MGEILVEHLLRNRLHILRRPIAWFPGMAGTENKESPKMECTEKGKSAWDRFLAFQMRCF